MKIELISVISFIALVGGGIAAGFVAWRCGASPGWTTGIGMTGGLATQFLVGMAIRIATRDRRRHKDSPDDDT